MKPETHSLLGLRLIPAIYRFKPNLVQHNSILRNLDMQFSGAELSVGKDVVWEMCAEISTTTLVRRREAGGGGSNFRTVSKRTR